MREMWTEGRETAESGRDDGRNVGRRDERSRSGIVDLASRRHSFFLCFRVSFGVNEFCEVIGKCREYYYVRARSSSSGGSTSQRIQRPHASVKVNGVVCVSF